MRQITLNNSIILHQDMVSNFRRQLRELQWLLPLEIQRTLFRTVARRYDPYSDWNDRYRAIFIHVPRSGGTSIAFAIGAPKPHIPISRYAAFDPTLQNQLFKFCVVRNPWDRLLSAFTHLRGATNQPVWRVPHEFVSHFPDFESFVLELERPKPRRKLLRFIHFRPQVDWLTLPRSNEIALDFVGRYETLAEDYAAIAKHLRINAALPNVNASQHPFYRDSYSKRMRDIATDLYGRDIETLRYQF